MRLTASLSVCALMFSFNLSTAQPPVNASGFRETFARPSRAWHAAEYRFSHPMFDTDWARSQVRVRNGLTLNLTPQRNAKNRFKSGSMRRETATHWGRYEATLKAARGPGLVTGFFTYTGPAYGTRHDEIDFEFLGKDPNGVQVAYFVDGELTEKWLPLGFDTSSCFHTYAFDWTPEHIRWFVNDELVHEVSARSTALPETPSRLFANLWAADHSVANWAGSARAGTKAEAKFTCLAFTPWDGSEAAPLCSPTGL